MVPRPLDSSVLVNLQVAYEYFREHHPGRAAMEENKEILSKKYTRAKVGFIGT